MKHIVSLVAVLAVALLLATEADAQVATFTGASGGVWSTGSNWSLGTVPTASNDAQINANTTVNVTASATASTLTLIGADARMNVLGTSLTAAGLNLTGSSGENVRIFMDAGTLNLGGGTGSLTTTGGITSWLTLNNGTSTLNLGSSTLSYFWLASSGAAATTTIGSGTYTNAVTILGSADGSVATLNVNGGLFDAGTMYMNFDNKTTTSTMNLNGGTLKAQTIQRVFDGTAATFNWNNGTIANKSGVDLNLNRGASATQNLIVSLSGTGTHTFSADSGRTITVQSTATLADKAGQNGTLEKSGSGTLKFAGANTFSGATTLSAGSLNLADQNAIQNSTLTMNGGSVVFDSAVSGNAFTVGGLSAPSAGVGYDIALQNNAGTPGAITLTVGGNNASTTYAGVLSAAGGLTKSGSGVLTLTGANTFSGATTVSSGTLQIGNGGTAGSIGSTSAVSVASGATLAFNRSDAYGGNFTRTITGSGGVVLSSGSLTLQNTGNTFSGGVAVNGGVLKTLGNSAGNTITVNSGGSLGMAGTDTWGGATTTTTPAITINAGGVMTTDGQFNSLRNLTLAGGTLSLNGGLASTSSALVLGGTVTASGPVTSTIVVTSGSNNAIRLGRQGTSEATEFNVSDAAGQLLAGTVLDNNFGSVSGLTKTGSGVLVLSAANTYTGPTTVSTGTLQIGNGGSVGSVTANSGFTVASGATLAFNRSDAYGGALTNTFSGSGTVVVNAGSLTLNAAGSNGYASTLGVTVNNGATVTTGHNDMFGGTGWDATSSPAFTVNAGGTLASSNNFNTLWNLNLNGGTLLANGGANGAAQAFAVAGTVTVGGSIASTIQSGTVGNGLNAINISGNGNNTLTFNVADVTGNANADLTISAPLQNSRGVLSNLAKSGAGTVVLTGSSVYTGTTTVSGGVLQLGNGGTAGSIDSTASIVVASGGTLAFNRSDNYGGNYTKTITGSGGVALLSGTLTLQNTGNTFSGGIAVNGGVLKSQGNSAGNTITVNSGGSFGMAGTDTWGGAPTTTTPAITINAGGVMTTDGQFNSLRNLTLAGGTLSMNGGLASTSSALVLGGTVTASGPVTSTIVVTSGSNNAIRLGRQGTSEATEFNVSDAAGQLLAGTVLDNNFGSVSGLTKTGSGVLVLSAANTYTGPTTVSAGTLRIGNGGVAGTIGSTSSVSVAGGATLAFNRSDNYGGAFDRQITGSGAVTLSSGSLVLTNNDTYSGATTISAGTLQIGNGSTTGAIGSTSGISVASGATLAFNRSDAYGGNFSRTITGSGGVALSSGTLTLQNTGNTFSGGVVVNGGVFRTVGNSAGNTITVNSGGSFGMAGTDTWGNAVTLNTPAVTINAGGSMTTDGEFNSLRNLTLNGGTVTVNGGLNSATGALVLGGTVTAGGAATSTINSGTGSNNFIRLGRETVVGEATVFNVSNPAGQLLIGADLTNNFGSSTAGLIKSGPGVVVLSGSNSYTAATTVNAGILEFSTINALRNSSGVSIAGGANLRYSGGVGSLDRNITVTSGTGTVTNAGGGLLTLSGTLSKNGTVLRLTGGQFNVTGQIVGTNANSDLLVDGTSTVTLSSTNSYNGPTFVNQASNLIVGINNAIPSNSIVTLGNATTTGTLSLGSNSNAIGGLAFGGGGGTLRMTASNTGPAAQLTASTGTMTLTNGTLDLGGSGTSAGYYRLASAQSIAGSFASITGTSAAYQVLTTSTSIDYQQRAVLGAVSVTNPATAIITGGSAAFTYSVANSALSGGASLAVTGTGLSNVVGTSAGTAAAAGSTGSLSGLVFTGTSIGNNQQGTFNVNAASAYGATTATGTVAVTVLDHATSSLASGSSALLSTVLNLGTWDYSQNLWTSGTSSGLFTIANLASSYGANLTADLSLVSVSSAGNGFTTNLNTYTDIAGGQSRQYSVFVDPTSFLTSGTQSWMFTIGMSDKTGMSGAAATNNLSVTAQVIVVPEPGALALAGVGVAAAAWALRRRR